MDCFTGQSTTAKDYRVPFSLASGFFLLLIVFIVFFLDVKVEKQDRKLTLKQEFGWVSLICSNPFPAGGQPGRGCFLCPAPCHGGPVGRR